MSQRQLEALQALVPVPASPAAEHGDFVSVENELETSLPNDWKQLVSRYGYGTFGDFLHLWSPFFEPCTMVHQVRRTLAADRDLATAVEDAVPLPLHPDPGGALPWANTDNGDVAYWLTQGDPDTWPVVIWNPRGGTGYDRVEEGAAGLIARWMAGELDSQFLPANSARCFDPWRERKHFTIQLSGESRPFAQRLRALFDALSPVQLRAASGSDDDEKRQVHFAGEGGAWRFTYDTIYGHNLRVAVPPGDAAAVRARIRGAAAAMGCTITRGR